METDLAVSNSPTGAKNEVAVLGEIQVVNMERSGAPATKEHEVDNETKNKVREE